MNAWFAFLNREDRIIIKNIEVLLALTVAVPLIGAFSLPLAGRISERSRDWLAFVMVFCSFLFSLILLPNVLNWQTVKIVQYFPLGLNISLTADPLAVFMALISSSISAVIILFSFDYISHYENRNEYYLMVVLFLGAMMGIIYSSNLILLFLFWEITGIVSWRLVGFFREKTDVLFADKTFLVTVFGALLMLIGFISIYNITGSFDYNVIHNYFNTTSVPPTIIMLVLAGILAKSATLPFHTWLPDAGVAPSSVTALLHAAVLVKIGVYVYARLFVVTMPVAEMWHMIIPVIACASAIISAGAAMIDTNLKRIIAYSTISQIGFIFIGLSTNNRVAIAGGLLYILMHGIAKAGLFLCAGVVEQNTHLKDITKMGGLIKTMPYTALAFLVCSLSIMGIPPFGGFFSKFLVFQGIVDSNNIVLLLFTLFAAFLTIIYLFRTFTLVFLGEAKIPAKEGSGLMVGSVVFFAAMSLLGGVLIKYPLWFVSQILLSIFGS